MLKRIVTTIVLLLSIAALLAACATLKSDRDLPPQHPYEIEGGAPTCTECHEDRVETVNFKRFNHTTYFADNHRQEAYQERGVCAMCHQTSFCNDCHATRVELKPSIKNQTDTYRRMPHRGNYLSRHRADGRVDPTSCFRCHGNPKTAKTCARCHG